MEHGGADGSSEEQEQRTAHKQKPPGSSQQDGNVLSAAPRWQVRANNRVLTPEA